MGSKNLECAEVVIMWLQGLLLKALKVSTSLSLSLHTRRLSSKKRKKVASQYQASEGSAGSSDQQSGHSPVASANGSPAVTSTTCTPPALDKRYVIHQSVNLVCLLITTMVIRKTAFMWILPSCFDYKCIPGSHV